VPPVHNNNLQGPETGARGTRSPTSPTNTPSAPPVQPHHHRQWRKPLAVSPFHPFTLSRRARNTATFHTQCSRRPLSLAPAEQCRPPRLAARRPASVDPSDAQLPHLIVHCIRTHNVIPGRVSPSAAFRSHQSSAATQSRRRRHHRHRHHHHHHRPTRNRIDPIDAEMQRRLASIPHMHAVIPDRVAAAAAFHSQHPLTRRHHLPPDTAAASSSSSTSDAQPIRSGRR
jgi:hypothetical protein